MHLLLSNYLLLKEKVVSRVPLHCFPLQIVPWKQSLANCSHFNCASVHSTYVAPVSFRKSRFSFPICYATEIPKKIDETTPKISRGAVFWDLDNKQPNEAPPSKVVEELRSVISRFTQECDILAYANRHAFSWIPDRVRDERRERKRIELLEKKGEAAPDEPYRCPLCGAYLMTSFKLKQHFKNLHEREQRKKMAHIKQSKASRRRKLLSKYQEKTVRYVEAARQVLIPKKGYGLMGELRRSGVHVRLVSDAPEAADVALKKDMQAAIKSGQVSTICVISDDKGFTEMVEWAKNNAITTIVIGNTPSLRKTADMFFLWDDLMSGRAAVFASKLVNDWENRKALAKEIQSLDEDEDEEVDGYSLDGFNSAQNLRRNSSSFSEEEESEEADEFELPFFAKGWSSSMPDDSDIWSLIDSEDVVVEHEVDMNDSNGSPSSEDKSL